MQSHIAGRIAKSCGPNLADNSTKARCAPLRVNLALRTSSETATSLSAFPARGTVCSEALRLNDKIASVGVVLKGGVNSVSWHRNAQRFLTIFCKGGVVPAREQISTIDATAFAERCCRLIFSSD